MSGASNLHLDSTNGLWAEPPDVDLRRTETQSGGTIPLNSTSMTVIGPTASSITNPDPLRPVHLFGTGMFNAVVNAWSVSNPWSTIYIGARHLQSPFTDVYEIIGIPAIGANAWSWTVQLNFPIFVSIAAGATVTFTPQVRFQVSAANTGSSIVTWSYTSEATFKTQRNVYR